MSPSGLTFWMAWCSVGPPRHPCISAPPKVESTKRNGLFEDGESCAGCLADCVVGPCNAPGAPTQPFRVDFMPPPFQTASSITVLLGYRDTKVSIPGNANDGTVGGRILMRQSGATVTPTDLNYALRVVYSRAGGINPGRVFVLSLDTCSGQAPATVADFTCIIEGFAAPDRSDSDQGSRATLQSDLNDGCPVHGFFANAEPIAGPESQSELGPARNSYGPRTSDHVTPEAARLSHLEVTTRLVLHGGIVPDEHIVVGPVMPAGGCVCFGVILQLLK